MCIVQLPRNLNTDNLKACAICRVKLCLSTATAGLFDTDSRQAFACVSHLSEVELLIVGWADFMAAERYKHDRRKREAEALGVGNAWLNS